eukprot:symbB.v1.2.004335.t1/scaffold188.1/size279614/24
MRFHILGDALVDVVAGGLVKLPEADGDATAETMTLRVGGSALNTAVHLASLVGNGRVSFYASVGSDALADTIRERLEADGIDANLQQDSKSTGTCVVLSGAFGRSFVTCYGAAVELCAECFQRGVEEAMELSDEPVHVHLGGMYSYGARLRSSLAPLLQRWRRATPCKRFSVSVEVNGHEVDQLQGVRDLLPMIDLFKGNVKEVEALLGCEWNEAMTQLVAGGCAAVITHGAEGASWRDANGAGEVVSPDVMPADCTGAGDACTAAVLASWTLGEDLEAATTFGCAAGALNCTYLGGCETPISRDAIEALLSEQKRLW